MVDWDYYDKFEDIESKYLPLIDEGNNRATQIVTAVVKLVYKWYNDGDVFDNSYCLSGWYNNLSSYANWLANNYPQAKIILRRITRITEDFEYEELLKNLADTMLVKSFLAEEAKKEKIGSIYNATGIFKFIEEEI